MDEIIKEYNYVMKIKIINLLCVQAIFNGLSSLSPASSMCTTSLGPIPGYGDFPEVNTSQHSTPYDHYMP